MKPLTKSEKQWIKDVQELLMTPPSQRLGLFTIGDASLTVYDKSFDHTIDIAQEAHNSDFCQEVDRLGCRLADIDSAIQIHSTAG